MKYNRSTTFLAPLDTKFNLRISSAEKVDPQSKIAGEDAFDILYYEFVTLSVFKVRSVTHFPQFLPVRQLHRWEKGKSGMNAQVAYLSRFFQQCQLRVSAGFCFACEMYLA
jgi:hypothetical protein